MPAARPATAGDARPVQLGVIVDWQGRDLANMNLEALRAFRQAFGDVAVLHVVSPAYFLRPGLTDADRQAITLAIKSAIQPADHLGIALVGWKSLAAKAGVIFRDSPTFWSEALSPGDCAFDCGIDVPLHLYPEKDLDQLFAAGLDTLEANGFGRPNALITEGWMAAPEVLAAAARAGIRYDFSAVAPELIAPRTKHYPIYQWVKALWQIGRAHV